jgi:hypothetical protein
MPLVLELRDVLVVSKLCVGVAVEKLLSYFCDWQERRKCNN